MPLKVNKIIRELGYLVPFLILGGYNVKLILYKTADPRNKIEKTLTGGKKILITLKRDESKETPRIKVSNSQLSDNYNYAYIDTFERYYFINSTTKLNYSLSELELETDLLTTYKTSVLASTGLISHAIQEGDYRLTNPKTSDNFEMELFESDVELEKSNTILLTTISGLGFQEG